MDLKVTYTKLGPLLPSGFALNPDRVLKSLQRQVLRKMRGKLLQATFSDRAKRALSQGVKVKIGPRSVTVIATHPAFLPLLRGQEKGQMTWLTKARAPIPIVTDEGKLIFRSATPKSMSDGKWIHPGREPTTIIERAREEARQVVKEKLAVEFRRQLRQGLRSAIR